MASPGTSERLWSYAILGAILAVAVWLSRAWELFGCAMQSRIAHLETELTGVVSNVAAVNSEMGDLTLNLGGKADSLQGMIAVAALGAVALGFRFTKARFTATDVVRRVFKKK